MRNSFYENNIRDICDDTEKQSNIYENMNSFSDLNFHILQGKINHFSKNDNNLENLNSYKKYIQMKDKVKSGKY